jgi:hypothetical protein
LIEGRGEDERSSLLLHCSIRVWGLLLGCFWAITWFPSFSNVLTGSVVYNTSMTWWCKVR